MTRRKIIKIDEDLCNGCGECVSACAEGALQLIDGKARLVSEQYCDGLGDCLGECPTGALTVVEREVAAYDSEQTREHVMRTGGAEAVSRFNEAEQKHQQKPSGSGCPGMRELFAKPEAQPKPVASVSSSSAPAQVVPSDLQQWPVQLHLVRPGAPYFSGKELLLLSTCGPVASADVHWRFIRGRSVVLACPKLDKTEGYIEKLAGILQDATIPALVIVRMEVPCCGGLTRIAQEALRLSGRTDLSIVEETLALNGEVISTQTL